MNKHTYRSIDRPIKLINRLLMVMVAAIILTVSACEDDPEEPSPTPAPPPSGQNASRTVLVYMVATNSLGTSSCDTNDLVEMLTAAENGDLGNGRLIVYHNSNKGNVLKEITPTGIDTLKVYDNTLISVSIERMTQVIDDVKELSPTDDYGMVLWSHASGWLQDGIPDSYQPQRSFGYEGSFNDAKKMNITSLRTALEGAGMSWLYFDCCFMGSVEVMYELRNCADYVICSPAEIPVDGMPYDLNLKYMFDTSLDIEDMMVKCATTTFNDYNDVFVKGDCPNTMAVIRMSEMDKLAEVTAEVYKSATTTYNNEYKYQQFGVGTYNNKFYDLQQYVESVSTDNALTEHWNQALAQTVVYASASPWIWTTRPIELYCGLSTYIMRTPSDASSSSYSTLSWYKDVAKNLIK